MTSKTVKKQILAAKVSTLKSLNNEAALKYELSVFFQKLKEKVLHELEEYYNSDFMFQAHADLILAPIFESHQEYYNILRKYNHKEYKHGRTTGRRLVKLAKQTARKKSIPGADKAENLMNAIIRKDELFKTNPWAEEKLLQQSFTASENTINRIDRDINKILSDGYKSGMGINKVRDDIIKRFDQLKDWEATRIARTEIHNAHNMGTMDIYQEMNVQYTQWIAAHDTRTRDTHRGKEYGGVDRQIIPMGSTYSNGLRYPGDTSGPIKEWINCRCSHAPFIIPYGYAAPSFTPFYEDDLITTLDYYNADDLITQATAETRSTSTSWLENEMTTIQRSTETWDINRLTPGEKELYLQQKKNYIILKDAMENNNYQYLDDLEDLGGFYSIRDRKSFMEYTENGTDFDSWLKDELEDYIEDLADYEKIIKDTNIKVNITPKSIKWKNKELKEYRILNDEGKYVPVNQDEKFIKYHFKDENLTILESVDMDYSRVRSVYESYKNLPKSMKKTKEIVLSSQKPRVVNLFGSDSYVGGYVTSAKGDSRIVQFHKSVSSLKDTLVHESAHLLEKDKNFFISNSNEYVLAFKKDQQRLLEMGYSLEDSYVTPYAHDFTEEFVTKRTIAIHKYGNRQYSEDFAESVKMYLADKKGFTEKFPNKAKVIEKAIRGKYKVKNTVPYENWVKTERTRFNLTDKEMHRQSELRIKQTELAKEGKPLSRSERKELEFLEDKQKVNYLYNKKINGEILDTIEEKAYSDLTKKWKKKLKIPNEVLNEKRETIKTNFTKYITKDNKYSIKVREVTDKQEFRECLEAAKESQPIHARWRVEIPEKLSRYDNCKMFVTEHGSTVAIDEHGDIISVCAKIPKGQKKSKDSSRALLEFAVKNGGTKLDSYDGNYWFYRKCGFEPVSYCEFVEDFAPDDWKKWHAFNSNEFKKENIIFFKHTGKQSKYVDENEFYDNVDVSKDYDDAEHIRDDQFTMINKVKSWLKNIR